MEQKKIRAVQITRNEYKKYRIGQKSKRPDYG